jgi:hypothetical protein
MKKVLLSVITLTVLSIGSCKKDTKNNVAIPEKISCSDITADKTLTDRGDGIDYILDCVVSVYGRLTIAPGVIIQCKANSGFWVANSGSLSAVGTAAAPINFKAETEVPGFWKGIYFQSNNPLNELNYCTVEYAGSNSFDGNADNKAAVRVSNTGKLKIANTKVWGSGSYGLLVSGIISAKDNPISSFTNNEFSGNYLPLSIIAPVISSLDGVGSKYVGNTINKIEVRGGVLTGNHTWQKIAIPYLIKNTVYVGDGSTNDGNLIINPGVLLQFAGDQGLGIGDFATGSSLKIVGTATERITLTGETPLAGSWKGIAFQSNSPINEIAYTDISFGGSSSFTGNPSRKANINGGAYSAGTFKISNATVSNSAAFGIYITAPSANVDTTNNVTFSANASGNYKKE